MKYSIHIYRDGHTLDQTISFEGNEMDGRKKAAEAAEMSAAKRVDLVSKDDELIYRVERRP